MKKLLSIVLTLALCLGLGIAFSACEEEGETPYSQYNLSEYVVIPDYDSYEIQAAVPEEVTEKEIQKGIEADLAAYATTYKIKEGTVEKGDSITISYEGQLADGTTSEEISATEYSLGLGEGGLIDGIEEGLYGAEIGEEITIETTFPDPYYVNTALSGKDVVFTVIIDSKDKNVLPDLTDEFIQEAHDGYYNTVEEYMADVKAYYENQHEEEAVEAVKEDLYDRLVQDTEVLQYPEEKVIEEEAIYVELHVKNAENNSIEWETYLESNLGMTEEEFTKSAEEYAKYVVKQDLLIYAIAEKENLVITEEEYDLAVEDFLENTAGMNQENFEDYVGMSMDEFAEKYKLEKDLLKDEALALIYDRVAQ